MDQECAMTMVDNLVADRDAEVEDRKEEAAAVELSEWAVKEKLSSRFKEELSNNVRQLFFEGWIADCQ
eukprot:Skav229356  [mRNA]  locus=scaffold3209:27438:27641:- [translate_table: standard]